VRGERAPTQGGGKKLRPLGMLPAFHERKGEGGRHSAVVQGRKDGWKIGRERGSEAVRIG